MKRVIFTLLTVVLCTLLSAQTIVEKHGRLRVKDAHVVNKDGEFISLCGNSLFWSTNGWGGEKYYNHDVVKFLKDDWNSSIVRIAMGVEGIGDYRTDPAGQTAKVKTVVDACIEEGLYVIIDFHAHSAHNYKNLAITFFEEMATLYGEYDNVIYEIFNEPLNVSWANVIKPYAEEVIAAIREIDPDNLIIVGTRNWSQEVVEASLNPIDDVNVAYALHFYADSHKQWLRDAAITAMNNGAALFVTEWGTCNASGNTGHNEESSDEWMSFCKDNYISVCNWAINDKDETASALLPGASKEGGWTEDDYTPSGKYVRNLMLNWNKPCEYVLLPNTIKAENYCRLSNAQRQPCSEGGKSVGNFGKESWLAYQVTVEEAGVYTVSYRIASLREGGKIQLVVVPNDIAPDTLDNYIASDTLDLPKTGGSQEWVTVSHDVMLPAGTYDLQLLVFVGGFNINWIKIMPKTEDTPVLTTITLYPSEENVTVGIGTSLRLVAQGFDQNGNPFPIDPVWGIVDNKPGATIEQNGLFKASEAIDTYTVTLIEGDFNISIDIDVIDPCPPYAIADGRIEAEDYCAIFDAKTEVTGDVDGELNVGWLNSNSSWITYSISVPVAGTYWLDFRTASANTTAGRMDILVDGVRILTQSFPRTGGWQTYQTTSTNSFELTAGRHELRFNILAGGFNINWFEFKNVPQSVSLNVNRLSDIYPNPVRRGDLLHISLSSAVNRIRMTDLRGIVVYTQSVASKTGEQLSISTDGLTGGIYLLELVSDQSREVYKVVVE